MNKLSTSTNRIVWVDICRIICMFCILMQHSIFLPDGYYSPWHGIIMGMAYDFTRPILPVLVFFFFSGWLQKVNSKYIEWKKPLLLYAPAILFWNIVQLLVQPEPIDSWQKFVLQLGVVPFSTNANGPLWFLQELMFYTLLLPLIQRIPIHLRIAIIICSLWLGTCYYGSKTGIHHYANNISFFLAGTLLHNTSKETIYLFLKKTAIWFVPVTCILVFGILLPEPFSFQKPNNLKYSGLSQVAGFLSMCGFSILVSILLPKFSKAASNCCPAIFFLYASHWPLFTVYKRIALHFEIPPPHPYIYPLFYVGFMIIGTGIWKIATTIRCRWLHSIVFMFPLRKT